MPVIEHADEPVWMVEKVAFGATHWSQTSTYGPMTRTEAEKVAAPWSYLAQPGYIYRIGAGHAR